MKNSTHLPFFCLWLCLGWPLLGYAQNARITLQIFNKQSEPLPFANVVELGTLNGTITDLDGKASLSLMNPLSASVQVSFIGYKTILINPADFRNHNLIKITMEVDEIQLAELEVIDIGTDPKAVLLEALNRFYRNSKRPTAFPKYRYTEELTETINGRENKVQVAALVLKTRGKVNRSNRLYSGKEKDSHFLVQNLYRNGESMYDDRKDPITNGIIQFNNWDKEVDFESDLLFKRFDHSIHFMENRIYDESVLSDLDWRITKLQKSDNETLALFEHRLNIESSFYDKIFIRILVELASKQIKSIAMQTDRDITLEPLGRVLPEFKDRLAFEAWDKAYEKERYQHHWSKFLGKGQMAIHYIYDAAGIPIPKNVLMQSSLFHHTLDGDFDIQVQARLDLVELAPGKTTNPADYIPLDFMVKWPDGN